MNLLVLCWGYNTEKGIQPVRRAVPRSRCNFIFFRMAECMGFAYTVPVHKPHVQNNSNRINGIIRGKFVLLCLPGRSKKRTLFQDISGGMVSYHAGSYVFSGEGDKWDILFYSRA